jgi:predicted O-linked N-acetylglucosamine transferase (SPINDLY family)
LEALGLGVQLVSLAGDHFVARVGASLLAALGLDDWVAQDEDAYVRIAVGLAETARASPAPRAALRSRILRSPLCDAPAYARAVEEAYRAMWREWCAGP